MNTITAILEPDPDGTVHLPVPEASRNQPIRVKAELEPVAACLTAVSRVAQGIRLPARQDFDVGRFR